MVAVHEDGPSARPPLTAKVSPTTRWLLAGFVLWLLVGPRIELSGLRGLRVEDLVLAATGLVLLLHVRPPLRLGGPTAAVCAVVAAGLVSVVVASARGAIDPLTGALFAVRPIEYWIAFPATLLILRSGGLRWDRRADVLLTVVTVLQSAFAVLQFYFQVPVGFSHAAYTRAAGLTVGPYELGAMSAALLVYWVAQGRVVTASLATVALAASISRVSILGAAAALAVLAVFWLIRRLRRVVREGVRGAFSLGGASRLRITGKALVVATSLVVLAFTLGLLTIPQPAAPPAAAPATGHRPATEATPAASEPPGAGPSEEPSASAGSGSSEASGEDADPQASTAPSDDVSGGGATAAPAPAADGPAGPAGSIADRLESTSVLGSWNVAGIVAERAPTTRTSAQYIDVAYTRMNDYLIAASAITADGEASNLVRFFRWHVILRAIDDPVDVLVGLGPSFVGPSVDGSYLRIFAEGGALGLLAWGALAVSWLRRSPLWMTCVTVSLLVGATFIDILYAERPMVLFWALLAIAVVRSRRGRATRAEAGAQPSSSPAAR